VIACVEKNKVMRENLVEIRQICQDALEDAVLMGCDEQQVRSVLIELVNNLSTQYTANQ
jgi:Mor family transcriptional regulator